MVLELVLELVLEVLVLEVLALVAVQRRLRLHSSMQCRKEGTSSL